MRFILLLFLLIYCHNSIWSQISIYINRKQTCVRTATSLLNNCVIKDIKKGSINYKRVILPIASKPLIRKTNNNYYAHLNLDSSITFRKIRWKKSRYKFNSGESYLYIDIKNVDFEIHQIFEKKEMKECEYCYQDKKIVYLDSSVQMKPTLDKFSLYNSEYKYAILQPKMAIVRIDSNYISDGTKYYWDPELKNEIKWKKGRNHYSEARIPVERTKNIQLNKPRIYRQLTYCPDQRKMDSIELLENKWPQIRPIYINNNTRFRDYKWKFLPFLAYNYNNMFSSSFYQIGLETQYKKQRIIYTFGLDKNQQFTNTLKYNYNLLNLHANNRFQYKAYHLVRNPLQARFSEANYQLYLGNSFQFYQSQFFYAPYLGITANKVFRTGKISLYLESGTSNILKKGTRIESRTEFGIRYSMAIQYL